MHSLLFCYKETLWVIMLLYVSVDLSLLSITTLIPYHCAVTPLINSLVDYFCPLVLHLAISEL